MRKTFPLSAPGKHPERLLEATKHEIRKYVRRERRRELPEGMDYWDFDCRFGTSEAEATPVHFATIITAIDAAAKAGESQFFVEILARAAKRGPRGEGQDVLRDSLDEGADAED